MATTMNQIYTVNELQNSLESVQATECYIYSYGYYDKETSEDPIACIHGAEETIEWVKENPAYSEWGEDYGYMVVIFNENGHSCNVIF